MTALSAPPSGPASHAPADILAKLKSQAGSAALRLQETLDSVLVAFEAHNREIASLREALSRVEARMQTQMPAMSAMVQPVRMPEPVAQAQIPFPATAQRAPSGPIMTQILWPSKEGHPEMPPQPAPVSTRPISKPVSIVESMLNGAPPPSAATVLPPIMQSPVPMQPSPVSSASMMNPTPSFAPAPQAPMQTVDPLSPQLEKATLEELNAALAYAFAQVSGTKGLGKGGITQMMPPPLPTQAMRFGQAPDYAGQM